MLPVLKQYFHLSTLELAIGLTLINLGFPLGSFLQSFSDNYGRSPFVFLDTVIIIAFGLLSVISWSFYSFVVFRFFYEIGIGFCLPLTSSIMSEISPAKERGPFLAKLWIIWVCGYFASCLLGYLILTHNNWRLMLLILCLPSVLSLFIHCCWGRETVHYLWAKKEVKSVHLLVN